MIRRLAQSSIRFKLMAQTIFFALIFFLFTTVAIWQLFTFTQSYAETAKRNSSLQLAAEQTITSAKQMDWLIQRILLNQYRGNLSRLISRQGDLLEAMADFEMFIEALNWGSESSVFKSTDAGIHYQRWHEKGWDRRIVLSELPNSVRQYAGTSHLYYSAFMKYTSKVITYIQGYLNAVASGDGAAAENYLALANETNQKIERFEQLGSATLHQLIELTHQLNLTSLAALQENFRQTLLRIAVSGALLSILLLVVNHLVFTRLIARPLERLTQAVRKIDAEGLAATVSVSGTGEIAALIKKFNELITHLRHTTVKRDALLDEIEKHKATEEKLVIANHALESKKKALTAALDDLKRTNDDLQQTHMQLIEAAKMESVGRLAAGVAHEVKNPLCIIQMGVDYLNALPQMRETGHAGQAVVNDIRAAIERAGTIIKGLLNFSAPHELTMEESDVNSVIEEALSFLRHLLSSHHTQVIKSLDPSLPRIPLDKQKMHQVFINLFMNAVQAMPATGSLTVKTSFTPEPAETSKQNNIEGTLNIQILDTGTGFTEKSLQRAFDPFYTTKPAGQGTGLGLAVTRKIIEVHGGTITLENQKDGGAKITVKIPKERRFDYAETKNSSRR